MQDNKDDERYMKVMRELNAMEFEKAYLNPPPETKSSMLYVVTRTPQEAKQFARKHGIYPPKYHFVAGVNDLKGSEGNVVYTGTFYQRHDIKDIEQAVKENTALKVLNLDE